jgi:hypothetical protein
VDSGGVGGGWTDLASCSGVRLRAIDETAPPLRLVLTLRQRDTSEPARAPDAQTFEPQLSVLPRCYAVPWGEGGRPEEPDEANKGV